MLQTEGLAIEDRDEDLAWSMEMLEKVYRPSAPRFL
jgi:hypothetical protein